MLPSISFRLYESNEKGAAELVMTSFSFGFYRGLGNKLINACALVSN